jgi:3',5'-cyclic AMP phosphodiesterase CpdA
MIVIAHLSDPHLDEDPRSLGRAKAAMDYVEGLPFELDAVLITGDIADHGLPREYELARNLFASRHPVIITPGNHDVRGPFRQVLLRSSPSNAPINQVHQGAGFILAACDTSIPGRDDGLLDEETLAWLDGVLTDTAGRTPVLIAFHHPPVELHVPFVDSIRQFAEVKLAALVEAHPNIVAMLCGHAHTPAVTNFAGRPLIIAPGIVSTLRLPWEHRANPDHHVHLDLPPALAFHILDGNRLTTHYRTVPA